MKTRTFIIIALGILLLTSCNNEKYKIKQETLFENGVEIITTTMSVETDDYNMDGYYYRHKTIYSNQVTTTPDSLTIVKESEIVKVEKYKLFLIEID